MALLNTDFSGLIIIAINIAIDIETVLMMVTNQVVGKIPAVTGI
jgi:hypothetical protein